MFSVDKSIANNKKIGSRLVADFAVSISKLCGAPHFYEAKKLWLNR